MNVSLTSELEELVQQKVRSGLYHSASEVIREALRLLLEQDRIREMRLVELRAKIDQGWESARQGNLVAGDKILSQLETELASNKK